MALSTSPARPAKWRCALAALVASLLACGGPSGGGPTPGADTPAVAADEIAFGSVEEMQLELETIDNEIRGLEEYLAANPGWSSPDPADPDPRAVLDAARSTRDAAASALAGADTAGAADSLRAASARIEHVKRLLGVAEEMGVEIAPDSAPPAE
ncbi:MAG TPA: hypothetical protein VJ982_00595 [Gemmatimonadota bacterium]|nr:hypothetical protein [Gemmatimonadota bacterium]